MKRTVAGHSQYTISYWKIASLTVTYFLGRKSSYKKKLGVNGFNLNECSNIYRSRNSMALGNNVMCAGGEEGKDSCSGDSGIAK